MWVLPMNDIEIDELRRAAEKAGRGENVVVDAETLLELVEAVRSVEDALPETPADLEAIYKDGFKHGFEFAVERVDPPTFKTWMLDQAWDHYKDDEGL